MLVLDLSLLQGMPSTHDLPPQYRCVVPYHAFHEIATKQPDKSVQAAYRFRDWARKNVRRMWIGRTPERLFEMQRRSGGKPLTTHDIIDFSYTRELRRIVPQPDYDWARPLAEARGSAQVSNRNVQIETLVKICNIIKERSLSLAPKDLPKLNDHGAWVRRPGIVETAEAARMPWRKEWHWRAESNPNCFAVTRWLMFLRWYVLKHVVDGQTREFANNFDDVHYGLLASYTGHLGTEDNGMHKAVHAIFPGLRVIGKSGLMRIPSSTPTANSPGASGG
jgi:hypothetical protein